jgi:hypothetical protein
MTHRRRWPWSAVQSGIAGRDRVAAEGVAGDVAAAVAAADEDATMDAAVVVADTAGMGDGDRHIHFPAKSIGPSLRSG